MASPCTPAPASRPRSSARRGARWRAAERSRRLRAGASRLASRGMVLRVELELVDTDRGGRRRPLGDGYRGSMSFGRRRRDVEPIVHDAVLVLEDVDELAPGERATARAHVVLPDELPRHVAPGTVFTLLEGD